MVQMVDVRDFLKIQNLRVCKIEKLEEIVFAILLNQKQESVLLCVSYKNNLWIKFRKPFNINQKPTWTWQEAGKVTAHEQGKTAKRH